MAVRASAFAHLDDSAIGWFHIRSVLVAGAGFFGDAYDIFVIGLALPMIYRVYYPNGPSATASSSYAQTHPHIDALLKASTNWGNLFGQLGFGYLGDKLGRKRIYGVEIIIMTIAIFGSTLAADTVRGVGVLTMLAFWRFVLGVGIGGDYPMSATITSEFAQVRYRGMMIAAVFAMQGIGILIGGLVTLIFLAAFSSHIETDPLYLDYVWRFMLGFGLIPCVSTIYFRLTMPESPRFTTHVKNDEEAAIRSVQKIKHNEISSNATSRTELVSNGDNHMSEPPMAYRDGKSVDTVEVKDHNPEHTISKYANISFGEYLSVPKNRLRLFATAYCWFALDIAWYGLSLNTQTVLTLINYSGAGASQYDSFWQKAVGNIIIACMGNVPGYWVTVFTVEKLGRKPIQIVGFGVITVILFIMAGTWNTLTTSKAGFLVLYTIANFFFNFGPNETTFIYPAEIFPTQFRARAHGISAAAGKVGAIIGIQAVGPFFFSNAQVVLFVFGAVMASGFLVSFLLPETKGRTLEEICDE